MNNQIVFEKPTLAAMIITALICVVIPFVIMAIIKRKTGAQIASFFYGMGIYFVFAFGVQGLVNILLFNLVGLGTVLTRDNHPVWYAIYGAVVVGVIEEIGKYIGLSFAMKKRSSTANALMYGLGHGSFASIAFGGSMLMGNAALAIMVNSLGIDQYISKLQLGEADAATYRKAVEELSQISASEHIIDGIQSVMYMLMQIALVMIVYSSVENGDNFKSKKLLILAIVLHVVGYMPYYLYQMKVITQPMMSLALMSIITVGAVAIAYRFMQDVKFVKPKGLPKLK